MESLIGQSKKLLPVDWLLEKLDIGGGPEIDEFVKSEYGYLLRISGLYPYVRNDHWFYSSIQFFAYIITLSIFIFVLLKTATYASSDYNLATQCLHFSIVSFVSLTTVLFFNINRKKLNNVLLIIRNDYYKYDDGIEIEELECWKKDLKYRKITAVVTIPTLISIIALSILGLPYIDSYFEFELKDIEGLDMRLPMPAWHPFSKDDPVVFYVLFFLGCWATFVVSLVISSTSLMYVFTNLSINLQFKILCKSIEQLEARAQNIYNIWYPNIPMSMEKMKSCYMHCIKQNVQHHLIIEKVFRDFYEFISVTLGLLIFLGSFFVAASAFAFVMGDTTPSSFISSLLFLVADVTNLGMLCYFGQKITDHSNEVVFALYSTNWPTAPKEVTLSIRIMIEKAKQPLEAKAFGLWTLNYELFVSIINTSYSYFNVLLGVKSRIQIKKIRHQKNYF